jgi:SAM-dependent methyltransferase
MIAAPDARTATFRDPAGSVVRAGGRIFRIIRHEFVGELQAFLETRAACAAIESGRLISSLRLSSEAAPDLDLEPGEALYEHDRITFPNYPYEWPAEMLQAAGLLTLDLALAALEEGFGLKDATPYNVLFDGPRPVFVDVLSFERRRPCDPTWMAYAQFVRTFLLPVLASRDLGWTLQQTLAGSRDGLEPEILYGSIGFLRRFTPLYLESVSLPAWLARGKRAEASLYHPKPAPSDEQARYVLRKLLHSCRKRLEAAGPPSNVESTWSQYLDRKSLYSPQQLAGKEAFVREALDLAQPATVLDVGANEGHFSLMAAHAGASVVAVDTDPVVVGSIWRRASVASLNVLPLVVDITRPTPATGWRNQECDSFLDRARGSFDMVMMLALMHHIVVTERVPIEELFALAADLCREYLLIEFVAPEDPMFQRIVRGREALYSHLTKERFETAARPRWELVRSTEITGLHRCLYLYRLRHAKK